MATGISDSRWPPQRPGITRPDAESALAQYPSYLTPRPVEVPHRVDRVLASVVTAVVVGLLAQALVLLLLVLWTDPAPGVLAPVLLLVGLLGSWSQLLRQGQRGAFPLAFWGQVAAGTGYLGGGFVAVPLGVALGSVAAVGVMYALGARWRATPAPTLP